MRSLVLVLVFLVMTILGRATGRAMAGLALEKMDGWDGDMICPGEVRVGT